MLKHIVKITMKISMTLMLKRYVLWAHLLQIQKKVTKFWT